MSLDVNVPYSATAPDHDELLQQIRLQEQTIAELRAALAHAEERARSRTFDRDAQLTEILEATPDFIGTADMQGNALYMNRAAQQMTGVRMDGRPVSIVSLHPAWAQQVVMNEGIPAALRDGIWHGETALLSPSGQEIPISQVILVHRDASGDVAFLSTIARDISDRRRAEADRARHQEEIIRMQETALAELSTPLIPITDTIVAMPLIGAIDSRRAQHVIESLLHGVASLRAQTAILDITGVSVVDSQVANALLRAAQAVTLLGARVVLTGIRPEVAQTLVGLGLDLSSITTRATLQSGIAVAMRQ
jgi:rsbT co-antagonist protein RsbR